jgi:hypothetical protein
MISYGSISSANNISLRPLTNHNPHGKHSAIPNLKQNDDK